jgi:hypothetical protein
MALECVVGWLVYVRLNGDGRFGRLVCLLVSSNRFRLTGVGGLSEAIVAASERHEATEGR